MRAVWAWESGSGFLENHLAKLLDEAALSPQDRGLAMELAHGIVRWQRTLDRLIDLKATRKPEGLPRILLRLGLYQLFWLSRVPDYAAVDETVSLARDRGFQHQAGFINAMLRAYGREREATQAMLAAWRKDEPAMGSSFPEWLVARWRERFGPEKTAALMEWNNQPPKTYARVNRLKTEPGPLLEKWRLEDVEYDFGRWDWVDENQTFQLKSHPSLKRMESFRDGWFYIQDPSTLLAVRTLAPRPGEFILDLCAAPGGKTCYVAQCMANQGRLVACDTSQDRLVLLTENIQRLGVTNVETRVVPESLAITENPFPPERRFDRILVDAPCSNTGVLRRRVDLRWRLQASEIQRLCQVQKGLLGRAATLVRPGGLVVYSTCSMEPEENSLMVKEFLAIHDEFELESERELNPLVDGVDGAYVAALRRLRNVRPGPESESESEGKSGDKGKAAFTPDEDQE